MKEWLKVVWFFVIPSVLWSQKIDHQVLYRDIGADRYFRFNYENDFFAASDENYTQGYNFELVSPALEGNPLNYIFYKPRNAEYKYGLALEHIGFTPNDFVSPEIQFGDRPFAAAIMLKSFSTATVTKKASRLSQSISLGLIGPGAFGKEMQVGIHELTGNKIPRGWNNQIKNDVIVNYKLNYEKQLYAYRNLMVLRASTSLQLGSLFTNLSAGFNTSIGILNSPFTKAKDRSNFQVYLYAQPLVSAIGYDATLQGGLFNKKSLYTITSGELERFTAQFDYGIILKTGSLFFEYARTTLTKEFKTGNSAKWGGFKIGFAF